MINGEGAQDYSRQSDAELASFLKAGDQRAFKELYNRYWNILLDAAYKRLDSIDAAEELVQDLFVDIYLKRATLDIRSSLEGYLKNALKFKVFDLFRAKDVHGRYINTGLLKAGSYSENPEEILQLKELKKKIEAAIVKMPDKCREVFLMSRIESLSNKAIAEQLGISVSTVEKHISKAMTILKSDFSAYNFGLILLLLELYSK